MALERPPRILDRDAEWRTLESVWSSDAPELVLMSGQRRVGKSYLLAPLTEQLNGLYYQATRRTETEQLAALSRLLGSLFNDAALEAGVALPGWEAVLRYVLARASGAPFLLVLDEFPYLEEASPGLTSLLHALWDHEVADSRLKIVLAGSHVAWMAKLEDVDQPLYARFTRRILLRAFDYLDAARFYPGYDALEKLRAYGAFGGVAGRLAAIDPARPVSDNIQSNMLDPTMRLFDEAERILDPFLDDTQVHYSIIQAVAGGAHTWGEITKRLGKSAGSLSRPLRWLLDAGVLRRDIPITEPHPQHSRRALYRLHDPYLAFWHRFIGPLVWTGATSIQSPSQSWTRRIEPGIDAYMGHVFEEACRQYLMRAGPSLPFQPQTVGSWWASDGSDQVDAVAVGEGDLLVAECKWGRIGRRELERMNDRAARVTHELGRARRVHRALFSASGAFDDELRALAATDDVQLVNGEDIYAGAGAA